jgi:ATP-binding cassette subfamily B protein
MLSRVLVAAGDGPAEAGVTLSGGQWQRVAVARALVRDTSDLVILDEPSAGLDPEAEHALHCALERHAGGKTRILISHRLGGLRRADAIAVLGGGGIVEHGTHDELVARGGLYARLFRLQASAYHDRPIHAELADEAVSSATSNEEDPDKDNHRTEPADLRLPDQQRTVHESCRLQ